MVCTDAYRHGVSGILGPALSSVAKNVALVTRPLQLPVCSAFAAAVALSDKSQFPYFYRFMVTAATVGRTTSLFLEKYGWNRFTIVIDSESTYSSDVASVLVSSAAIAGQNPYCNQLGRAGPHHH
ncbi:periplasmic binding protein-like I [Blastocladiella britannica]|nr:periplasmic binding protein-like I [Blastocladiella britannica]